MVELNTRKKLEAQAMRLVSRVITHLPHTDTRKPLVLHQTVDSFEQAEGLTERLVLAQPHVEMMWRAVCGEPWRVPMTMTIEDADVGQFVIIIVVHCVLQR